ncbi:MAG: RNA 3'-terminal phosphate cyclase [Candidatus Hydrothermarchaeota archaeon]
MIEIDGSFGEGGGQILRTSLALGAVTKKPFKIYNIRSKRPNPGLAAQHLHAIKSVASICDAKVTGLKIGSQEITFEPGKIKGGDMVIDVGTAGSVTLILQALLPVLSFAEEESSIKLIGGTDVQWSPPIDYFKNVTLSALSLMGIRCKVELVRRGHYPKGGGIVNAYIEPCSGLKKIEALGNEFNKIKGISYCTKLPRHVSDRQANSAEKFLRDHGISCEIEREFSSSRDPGVSPGSGIVLWVDSKKVFLGASCLGKKGVPAEKIGIEASKKIFDMVKSNPGTDPHLADQIIPYMALAEGRSKISTSMFSKHALTNIYITEKFLNCKFEVGGGLDRFSTIEVDGVGLE